MDKIREVVEVLKACEPIEIENQPQTVKDFRSAIDTAIDFLQSYLQITGFPEEKEIKLSPTEEPSVAIYIQGFNEAIKLCKLALLKKVEGVEEVIDKTIEFKVNSKNSITVNIEELAKAIKAELLGGSDE